MTKELEHLEELFNYMEVPEHIPYYKIRSKFLLGVDTHKGEPSLKDMSLEQLHKEINDEEIDLLIYRAELARREGLK